MLHSAVLVAGLPLLVAVALWALVDLPRFLLVAVLGSMILPQTLFSPGGTQVAIADLLLVLAVAAWLIKNALRAAPDPWVRRNPLLPALALFVGVNASSLAWSVDPRQTLVFTLQLLELVILIPIAFATLPDSVKTIRVGFVAFVGFTSILAVLTAVEFVPRALSGDLAGTYLGGLHKNAAGSFMAAGLVFAYTLWLVERRPRDRRLLALASIIELVGLFSSGSRGAVIGALVAVLASSLLMARGRRLTIVTVAGAAVLYLALIGPAAGGGTKEAGAYDSSVVRKYSFANAWHKIEARPVLGTGAATYWDYIPQLGIGVLDPNNMFLLTWAETGILGLAALLFLLARYLQLLWRVSRLSEPYRSAGVAAGCVSLSLFVHFQVDITWTRGTSSLTFAALGLMLAVTRLAASASLPRSPRTDRANTGPGRAAPARELAGVT